MTLRLNGSSSGFIEIDAPAAAGSNTITLPTSNGSAEQFLKNSGTAGELEYSSMVETSTGVGIGTSSPSAIAHFKGAGGAASGNELLRLETEQATGGGWISFNDASARKGYMGYKETGNDGLHIVNEENSFIALGTNGSERARLDSSGRLGIGVTPSNFGTSVIALEVHSPSAANSYIALTNSTTGSNGASNGFNIIASGNDASLLLRENGNMTFQTNDTLRAQLTNNGRFDVFANSSTDASIIASAGSAGTVLELISGRHSSSSIGTGTKSFIVFSNGNVQNTNNSYGSISDVKLKENIADASSQWEDIKAIQVRNYNFKENTGNPTHTQIGVVAQEVETVSPGLVYETPDREAIQVPVLDENGEAVLDENGEAKLTSEDRDLGTVTKSVNYSVLYMKAVKALQEAMTRIEALEAKVAALEAAE